LRRCHFSLFHTTPSPRKPLTLINFPHSRRDPMPALFPPFEKSRTVIFRGTSRWISEICSLRMCPPPGKIHQIVPPANSSETPSCTRGGRIDGRPPFRASFPPSGSLYRTSPDKKGIFLTSNPLSSTRPFREAVQKGMHSPPPQKKRNLLSARVLSPSRYSLRE